MSPSSPRIVLVTDAHMWAGWLGTGIFWERAKHLYSPVKGRTEPLVAPASKVRENANLTADAFFSLEKLGFTSPSCDVDWGLVRRGTDDLKVLASMYEFVMAYAPTIATIPTHSLSGNGRGKVVAVLDEPPPATMLSAVLENTRRTGACSKCAVSHFRVDDPRVLFFPAPYEEWRFAPFVRERRETLTYFIQKRCLHASSATRAMRSLGYGGPEREGWRTKGRMTYASYLARLSGCRWAIALDSYPSAGQVVAEASMLGVPVLALKGKTNAELVLPSKLLIPRNATSAEAGLFIQSVVGWYDSRPEEYSRLSMSIRRAASAVFVPPSAASLGSFLSMCCEPTVAEWTESKQEIGVRLEK